MTDTASLRIAINTGDVARANAELDRLTATAGRTETSTNRITSSFFSLGRVLSSIALLGTAQQFIKMADTMTGVESKLKLVTNNTLDLVTAQQELFKIAQNTRQGFAETVDTYSNFAVAMGDMGKSQKDILRVTETVNKAIAISGGTTQQAAAATMQLGQAFASGTLRGDELNSIMENSKGLAQAIADGMGVPIGKLRTLGSEGKITAEILANALEKSAKSVDEKFGKVGVTVEASMVVLANSITNMIGKADKELVVTGSLGSLITDISKHIDNNTQSWVDSVQTAMDTMYPIAEAGFTNIKDLSEVTFEGVNALFSVMVHAFDGAVDSMDNKYRELGFFDYMSLGFIVVIEGFRQLASGGLSALTFLGKQFNTFQSIALDAIAGVMGAMGKFQNAVGGDGSAFLEAQTFWANKANNVKQDGLLIDRTQKAILDDMGKGVDRLIGSYDKLALKKIKAKEVDTGVGGKDKQKTNATAETDEQKKARDKAQKEAEKAKEEQLKRDKADSDFALQTAIEANQKRKQLIDETNKKAEEQSALLVKTENETHDKLMQLTLSETDYKIMMLEREYAERFAIMGKTLELTTWMEAEKSKIVLDEANRLQDELTKSLDFSIKIEFDTEGDFKGVSKIAKSMQKLTDESAQYEANREKAKDNTIELAKVEEDHSKNQIAGYANIAGAMSSMFAQGSKEAAAFKAIESGLAVVAGVRAIMTAGTGDPYTAIPRMIAMAAMVASTLQSAGIAFGAGSMSTSSDAFASQVANTGTGSTLGDTTAQSESITNSLEILSDIAKPELALISQMNKSLISIDQKIGGLSANILRAGGFAVGEGYVGSSSTLNGGAGEFNKIYGGIQQAGLDLITLGVGDKLGIDKFIGGITSKISSGLFGGDSETTLQDAGITFSSQFIDAAIKGLEGKSYQVTKTVTDGGLFSGDSTSFNSYFSTLDEYTRTQFQLVLGSLYDTTMLTGEALDTAGSTISAELSNFVVNIGKISLKGKTGEEIQTTLTAIFGKIGDEIATKAFPALIPFQAIGEGLFETMTRVASGMEEADYYIGRLGQSFQDIKYTEITNQSGDVALEALRQSILNLEGTSSGVALIIDNLSGSVEDLYDTYTGLDKLRFSLTAIGTTTEGLTSSMLYGAGGITALDDATQTYIDNYLSESEKVAYNTSVMTDAFKDIGLTIPTTKQGFTDLLKSIDVTTESGQELYGRMILLSDGFNELVDSSDNIKSSLFDNIKSFIDSINGSTSLDAPVVFSKFSTSFNDMIDAIANGSSNLEEVGQTALNNAQNYLNTVTATATAGRDIEFAKAILVNKFSGVIATPDTTLSTINDTLRFSLGESGAIASQLKDLREQVEYLNDLTTTNTATNIKVLSTQRSILGETVSA